MPAELSKIIDRCLTKERGQRIGTARELAELLEAAAASRHSGTFPGMSPRVPTLFPGPSPYLMTSIPPPPGMPGSTTQGPWADGRPTLRMRRRSSSTWVGVAMLLAAASLVGVFAFLRLRPPLVACAGRSSFALATSMARVHRSFLQLKVEATAEAEERAKEDAAKSLVLQPSDLPPVKKTLATAASGAPAVKGPKGKSSDPHGGVDSAGF